MSTRDLTVTGFLVLGGLVVVLGILGRARWFGLVPLVDVVDAVRASTVGRVGLVLVWMWAGWHFLAR